MNEVYITILVGKYYFKVLDVFENEETARQYIKQESQNIERDEQITMRKRKVK